MAIDFNSIGYSDLVGLDAMDTGAIGYDDIIGAETDDIARFLGIGAAPARGGVQQALAQRAAARQHALQAMQRGKQIVNVNPQQARMLHIGGFATQGAVAGSLELTVKAQEPCRPQRLTLGASEADGTPVPLSSLIILDIKVGTKSQLASNGGLPANMFSDVSTVQMAGFQYDTIQPGCDLVILFRTVAATVTVSAGLMVMALR